MLAVRQKWLERVEAHVGIDGDDVALKVARKMGAGVGSGGGGDVSALYVADADKACVTHGAERLGIGLHAGKPHGLVVGNLHFAAAGRAGVLQAADDFGVVGEHGFCGRAVAGKHVRGKV